MRGMVATGRCTFKEYTHKFFVAVLLPCSNILQGKQENLMDPRQVKGCEIANTLPVRRNKLGWKVPSQSGSGSYFVMVNGERFCSCPDFESRQQTCKHIYAVEFVLRRESQPDGTVTETRSVRVTYRQNWPAYNAAQVEEKSRFVELLADLCSLIQEPARNGKGRPRLPVKEIVTAAALKVYSLRSGRRASGDISDAHARGLLGHVPHYNSVFGRLDDASLTPVLKRLIETSAVPLRSVECDFAVDSSGFTTSCFGRWFEEKYGTNRRERLWLKAHIMVGVKTNVVTSVEVTNGSTNDGPMLPALVESTAQRFKLAEVSADKAYLSHKNLATITAVGAQPFVPMRVNSLDHGSEPWRKLFHLFQAHRPEFLAHYHKRSNVETTFSMVKAKFGDRIRSKKWHAQVNEVLLKILCHNICVLIQAIHELGMSLGFTNGSTSAVRVAG